MKCEADVHAPVGLLAAGRVPRRCRRARAAMRASASRAKTSTGASSSRRASSRIAASRSLGAGTRRGVHRGQQALAERRLLSAAGGAVPRGRRLRAPPGPARLVRARAARARDEPGRAPPCVGRRWPRPSRSRAPAWRRRSRSRRPGTGRVRDSRPGTPRSAGSRAVATSRPPDRCSRTASSKRCSMRASSPSIASRRTWSHGSSTIAEPVLDLVASFDGALEVTGRDRGPGGEEPVRGLIPRPVQPVVERVGAVGQLQRLLELAVMRHDVGEVVAAARLQIDVVDRVGQLAGRGDVVAGELEVTGRRLDPRREQQRVGPVSDRRRVAGGVERRQDPLRAPAVAEHDPGPAEPVDDVEREQRVVRGAPGQGGVDVGALGPGEGEVLGLATRRARPAVEDAAASANHAACAASARVGQPGVGHRLERERADAVEQPVADATRRRRRRSRANGSPAVRPRRSPRTPARRAPRGRTRPPASGAPPANVASAHSPRWSSGNSSS